MVVLWGGAVPYERGTPVQVEASTRPPYVPRYTPAEKVCLFRFKRRARQPPATRVHTPASLAPPLTRVGAKLACQQQERGPPLAT